jgi:MFS family permease
MKAKINVSLMAIVAEGLLSRLSFGLISFSLPLYARHMGLSLREVGVLAALNSAVAVGSKPLLGWVADRFGLKRVYVVSIAMRSLVSLALSFAAVPWELFAIRTAHGLSMSLRDPSANALIAEHGTEKSVASAFAWYQTARTVAGSVSKGVAGVLLTITAANYPLVFFLAFLLSVLPILVVGRYVTSDSELAAVRSDRESTEAAQAEKMDPAETATHNRPRPKVLPFAVLGFLIAGTAEMLNGLFPILATEYAGLSKAEAGIVYAVSTTAIIVAGPLFGWLSDHVSRRLVLTFRGVANTLSSILYVVAPTFAGVAVAKISDDLGKAAFRPAWGSLMARISSYDRRNRARTMSWMSMSEDAGGTLGPILASFLWSAWGVTALMSVRVLLALGTEIYAALVASESEEKSVSAGRLWTRILNAPKASVPREETTADG